MTIRHVGYIVALEHDCREDEMDHFVNVMKMMRGVASAAPLSEEGSGGEFEHVIVRRRDKAWREKLDLIAREMDGVPYD